MKLIEFSQGKDLNAEVYTRNQQRISFLRDIETKVGKCYLGIVDGITHVWNKHGEHYHSPVLDLMVKIDEPEPEYTYRLQLKDFLSSKFDTLEDLKHYLSHEIIKQGTIIKEQK